MALVWERCNSSDPVAPISTQHWTFRRFVGLRKMFSCLVYNSKKFSEKSSRHIRVKSISKTEFRPILNSFFQRYFKIHLRSIYCSPVHGLMTDQVCARSIFLTQVWNIYFMCILNKLFGETYLVKITDEGWREFMLIAICVDTKAAVSGELIKHM